MSDDVSLEEVVSTAFEHRSLDIHTAMPGRVEAYNASRNTVDVTPMLSRQVPTDDDDFVVEDLPTISDVRIAWPRAGGFAVTFPIAKGDYVLLVFCEAPTGAWRQTGAAGDPGDPERLGLSGAVAIPGCYPDAGNIASPSTASMIIGKIGTPAAQIEITATEVHLGAGATSFVALAGLVAGELTKISTAIAAVGGSYTPASVNATSTRAK